MTECKPYLIGAIIGNSRLLAGLSPNGQLERLFWPRIDTPQNIGQNCLGIRIGESGKTCWLNHEEWETRQHYDGRTNILITKLCHSALQVAVELIDFAVPGEDLLVRRVKIDNLAAVGRKVQLVLYSDMMIGEFRRYHTTVYQQEWEALWQFKQNSHFLWGGDQPLTSFQCGNAQADAGDGRLKPVRHAMASDGALLWDLGQPAGKRTVAITVYTAMGSSLESARQLLAKGRDWGYEKLKADCRAYWHHYLDQAKKVAVEEPGLANLYERSLLVFHLMTDYEHGSMLAAPEFDEDFTVCGGYSYCWGRDAAFITYAVDRAGLKDVAYKFYRWAMKAQNSNGAWEQRHYLDGTLAPNWGLQIDETGSIIWGMWQHYLLHREEPVLQEFWPAICKGTEFLIGFMDEVTGLPKPSMDLWEERYGEHTYSAVAVWAGISAAAGAAARLGFVSLERSWSLAAKRLSAAIQKRLWCAQKNCFLRGLRVYGPGEIVDIPDREELSAACRYPEYPEEYQVWTDVIKDVSLLGLSVPFAFLQPQDRRMAATAQAVEKALWSPQVGGIKRYENDGYIGGNPWILCTLWLALYYIKAGDKEKAKQLVKWAVRHQTGSGLLPEQVDKETGSPAWVIPLTWSHAMLVLSVLELYENE
jgi:oligosaccharide amylase